MPSSLPVELLRLILDNFACPPISNDGNLENPHLHELLSLCLTSKIFRQIAQPLLFAHVQFWHNDSARVREQLICLLSQAGELPRTRAIVFGGDGEGEEDESLTPLLVDFCRACTASDCMIASFWGTGVHALSGSHLKKLYINRSSLDGLDSSFLLPSLDTLALVKVILPDAGFGPQNFPSLRHFTYDDYDGLDVMATRTIASFSTQLDSLLLIQDLVSDLFEHHPSFPCHLLLVDYLYRYYTDFPMNEARTRQVRLNIGDIADVDWDSERAIGAMTHFAARLEDTTVYPHLHTVYLPLLDRVKDDERPLEVHQAVDRLILACRNRKIEVVHEEQPTGILAETQLSEEFMRRMTKERIEREASNGM